MRRSSTVPLSLQFLGLGVVINAAFTAAGITTVFLTSWVLAGLRRYGLAQRAARVVGGSVLIGLSAPLAASRD